jgi:hypothetical protein
MPSLPPEAAIDSKVDKLCITLVYASRKKGVEQSKKRRGWD